MTQDKNSDRLLYRIIQGRQRVSVDGLVFYIYEPTSDLIAQSYETYDEVFEESFMKQVYTEDELVHFLVENDLWTPLGDRDIETLSKDIEDKKVEAFHNFFKSRELLNIKRQLRSLQDRYYGLLAKKHAYDHLTCHGVAEQARWDWMLQRLTFDSKGQRVVIDSAKVSAVYKENLIDQAEIRSVARSGTWRTMWSVGKKAGSVFSRPTTELTRDQLTLMSFSTMYDNVYEHPECPDDKTIEDDDCLDGWFIINRRKSEQDRVRNSVDQVTTNPKIRNAKEQFIMVSSIDEAKGITDLNDPLTKNKIAQRAELVEQKGTAKDFDFADVQQDIEIMKNKMVVDKMRGR